MSDNDKKIQYKVSLEPLNTPPIFTISKEGMITFGEAVKNYPHDEQAKEFIKCVEQIMVNQPQSGAYQLGYDTARAEVIAEVRESIKGMCTIHGEYNCDDEIYKEELLDLLSILERGADGK